MTLIKTQAQQKSTSINDCCTYKHYNDIDLDAVVFEQLKHPEFDNLEYLEFELAKRIN